MQNILFIIHSSPYGDEHFLVHYVWRYSCKSNIKVRLI